MAAKYFNFVDGQRLPGDRVKEFLMNQAVIQCANQTEITGSGIEVFGARVALNMEDGQIWTYGGEPAAWAPAQNALDLDLLDARYLTRLAADGLYLTEIQADGKYLTDGQAAQKYLTILSAQGLYITEGEADGKYLTPSQANALYLTPLDADSRYLTLVSAGQVYLRKDDADTDFQKKPTTGTFITDIQAGQIYLSQTNAASTYVTQVNAGNLYISKGGAAGDINGNSTTIDGGKITTNSINVNRLVAGTLTGFRVQTSSTGPRIVLSESSRSISFWHGTNEESGRIQSNEGAGTLLITGPGSAQLSIGSTTTSFVGTISTGSNVTAGQRVGQNNWTLTGTRLGGVSYNDSGQLVPSASDARLKTNIESIDSGLDKVNQLNPVTFNWNTDSDNPAKVPGLIAQEVAEVFSEQEFQIVRSLINPNDEPESEFANDPMKAVEYESITPYLIKAIQELSAKNDALEARLAALEGGAQ
jgi:hypothetical protein